MFRELKVLHQSEAWLHDNYVLDPETGCWVRPTAADFDYSDGKEVESRLLRIVRSATDLSSISAELRDYCTDWPSTYHLHPRRSNLLRPVESMLKGRILEIGAGCGAITRFLGECGPAVHAVEGSIRRATVAAARCEDLENVSILVDSFDSLQAPLGTYDTVTLIGVLEYSRIYFRTSSGDPFDAMLAHVRRFLKPDGVLILAIENQLGLKYFAGYGEDHLGRTMVGIEDRYSESGVVTFGRQELSRRLQASGFREQQWWFPFPDYKLPTSVLSENWIAHASEVDAGSLVSDALAEDAQHPVFRSFSLEQASQVVSRNGLLGDLANSFLVVASAQELPSAKSVLGYRFAIDRRPEFVKEIRFDYRDGVAWRHTRRLVPDAPVDLQNPLTLNLIDQEAFIGGNLWQQEFYRVVNRPGWEAQDLAAWARTWFLALIEESGAVQKGDRVSPSLSLSGDFFDALPRNLIVLPDGRSRFIDQEWQYASAMEIGFLIFRAVLIGLLRLSSCAPPSNRTPTECVALFHEVVAALAVFMTNADLKRYFEMENQLQFWVLGRNPGQTLNSVRERQLPVRVPLDEISPLRARLYSSSRHMEDLEAQFVEMKQAARIRDETVAQLGAQIATLSQTLTERGRAIVRLHGETCSLTAAVVERDLELVRERQILKLLTSSIFSWRLTGPLRSLRTAASKTGSLISGILGFGRDDAPRPQAAAPVPAPPTNLGPELVPAEPAPSSLGRSEILERALEEMVARAGANGSVMDGYVHRVTDRVDSDSLDVKAVAFYLPQLYSGEADDGAGELATAGTFGEWSDVAKAVPRYVGHYQPHLPGELGFYDLRLPDVMRRQIDMARQYGIHAFCFHYYWYDGEGRFGGPLAQFLTDPGLDIHFCLCWANQNWRQRWGFSANEIPEPSHDSLQEDLEFIDSIETALSDPRYVRIDGKPLLVVYRADFLPHGEISLRRWRKRAEELGFPGLYLVAARSFDFGDPIGMGFDAALEFPPYHLDLTDLTLKLPLIDPGFSGRVRSYSELVENEIRAAEPSFPSFKTVMSGWDDEARKPGSGQSFAGAIPALYGRWLKHACEVAVARPRDQRLVFINAWNDWAQGAHLEPDRRFGYAHLHVTANVLRYFHNDPETLAIIQGTNAAFKQASDVAVILHCHYEDLIGPVFEKYISQAKGADVFVTTRRDISRAAVEEILRHCPNVFIQCQENRGRDIRPFLIALRRIRSLGYTLACKVHTKKTPNWEHGGGSLWRQRLMDPLLGSADSVARAAEMFSKDPKLGLLAPKGSVMDLRKTPTHMLNTVWLDRLLDRMGHPDLAGNYAIHFPAGSMYWFRVDALAGLDDLILADDEFEQEYGQADSTLAHAVERLVALYAEKRGYRMEEMSGEESRI